MGLYGRRITRLSLAWYASLVVSVALVACGGGDDAPADDTGADVGDVADATGDVDQDVPADVSTDVAADTQVDVPSDVVSDPVTDPLDAADAEDATDASVPRLAITATNPEDGDSDVPLDLSIAVSFDREIDPASVGDDVLTVTTDDASVSCQVMATGSTVILVAPSLAPTTEYTVNVTTDVRGVDGAVLGEDASFSFTTGETYSDGTRPRAEDFRPLGRRFGLSTRAEYLLLGLNSDGNVQLRDPLEFNPGETVDPTPGADLVYSETNTTLLLTVSKLAATGALDDDFYDEVAVVSWAATGAATLSLFDHGADSHASRVVPGSEVSLVIDDRPSGGYRYAIDMGDVDDDGLDEVLVAGVIAGASGAERLGRLWVLDGTYDALTVAHTIDLVGEFDPGSGYVGLDRVDVTVGNLDRDPAEELAVVFHLSGDQALSVMAWDDAVAGYAELAHETVSGTLQNPSVEGHHEIGVSAGDFDNDGLDELAVGYRADDGYCDLVSWLLDDADEDFALLTSRPDSCHDFPRGVPAVERVDLNNDGADELVVFGVIYSYTYYADEPEFRWLLGGGICDGENDLVWEVVSGDTVAVADINGDMREDVVYTDYRGEVVALGCVEHPHYDPDTGELESVTNHMEEFDRRGPYGTAGDGAVIATPNVDADSIVIEYGGRVPDPDADPVGPGEPTPTVYREHTVYFADNRILAVIAAPPCADGIGQNVEACSAGFGTSVGGSVSAGVSVAVRAGVLVGVEAEVQGGFLFASTTLAKVEAELSAELEVTMHASVTAAFTKTITNTTGYDQDLVIFSATPYDRYVYGILSHPDADLIDNAIILDVPQRPRIFAVSRAYYNATNGDQMDVGDAILPSVPGDLESYPSRSQVNDFLALPNVPLGLVGPVTTNEGTGSQSLEQELSTEVSAGGEITVSIDSMAKVCGATICGGVTAGFSVGASFETTIGAGTVFNSEVGAIDAEHFATERYDYGLFAYLTQARDPNGDVMQTFVVVNHWVD